MPLLNVAAVNPFIKAVDALVATMVHVPTTRRKPRVLERHERIGVEFTVGVEIALRGATAGTVALALSRPVALALASALAGSPFRSVNDDCRDALGEIANMIVGQAKIELGQGITMSTPRVVVAAALAFPEDTPVILLPFDTAVGPFVLGIACRDAA